jgi:hypothetical protein
VKIGRTDPSENSLGDTAVVERVKRYATGIADSATVVQAPGAAIFETWLHHFMVEKRKPVTIRFAFKSGSDINPREWFDLSPDLAQMLSQAFTSNSPQAVDEVSVSDLPVFLSGAMTVIRWHAERESPETLAALAATAEIQSLVDRMAMIKRLPTNRPAIDSTDSLSTEISSYSLPEDIAFTAETQPDLYNAARDLLDAPIKLARLEVREQLLEESETLRTYIAIAVAVLVVVIGLIGSPVGAASFAVLGTLLLAFWPNILPRASRWIVDHMRRDAAAARSEVSDRIDGE